ncbi:MAG: 2-hydroxyacyl-CoA dehydratase [Candidatus Bathyarchaeota archaeon]|nr:MAG: 2-hydroxyacyl-CoA dehydratase [Candidatus Bathyarchaeota archaeon]
MSVAGNKRRLQTTQGFYRNYVKKFYDDAHRAKKEKKPVAWVASTFPIEMLQAMEVTPVWPENYASVCAARQVSLRLCEAAERAGFSKDLCSYARCVLGSIFEEKDLPEGGLPKPDFLVASTGACDTHFKWFQVASRRLNRPLFLLDIPYDTTGAQAPEDYQVKHYVTQLDELISFLEGQIGKQFDMNRLRTVERLSDRTSKLWMEIQDCRKAVPAPMNARDAFSTVFFMLCIPGSEISIKFYEKLRDELKERVKDGVGAIEDEKHRVIWDNLPMWFNLRFFNHLNSLGAVIVAETFSHVWAGDLNPSKPLESLAKKYLPNFANAVAERRINLILRLIREWRVDGVILPTNWGCRMMSIGMTLLKKVIRKELGVPSLILNIDSTDWRNYNEAHVKTEIEAFIEMLRRKG